MSTTVNDLLNIIFDKITTEVEFNEEWNNGTGYFNNLVLAHLCDKNGVMLQACNRFKCVSSDGRKIVGVVTAIGNVFFFQHHERRDTIVNWHHPRQLLGLYTGLVVSVDQLYALMGGEDGSNYNIASMVLFVQRSAFTNRLRHPASQPGYASLTPFHHQQVARAVADRMALATGPVDANEIWNEEYHRVLLQQDFEGDEVSVVGYKSRRPDLNFRTREEQQRRKDAGIISNVNSFLGEHEKPFTIADMTLPEGGIIPRVIDRRER